MERGLCSPSRTQEGIKVCLAILLLAIYLVGACGYLV